MMFMNESAIDHSIAFAERVPRPMRSSDEVASSYFIATSQFKKIS